MFKKRSYVGVDICGEEARLAEISRRGKKISLKKAVICAPNEIYKETKLDAVIALPYSATSHKSVTVAASLREREIERYLRNNLSRLTGIKAKELYFDFRVSPRLKEGKKAVEMVVAKKSLVREKVELLKSLGLNVVVVEPFTCALVRALNWLLPKSSEPLLLFYLNGNESLLLIIVNDRISFAQEFSIQGKKPREITEEIKSNLQKFNTREVEKVTQMLLIGTKEHEELQKEIEDQSEIKIFQIKSIPSPAQFFLSCGLALWR